MEALPMMVSAQELNEKKQAPHVSGVLPLFHDRWSPRSFADREVSHETLAKIFEAARWAMSSGNEQPWRYIVGLRGTATHKKIFEALVPGNQKWASKAQVLIIGTAAKNLVKSGAPNKFAMHDLGAADGYLVLQTASLGLAAHQMAGYDEAKARELLGIPEDFHVGSVIALGYQDDPEALGDSNLVEREVAPRTRKALSEIVQSAWGESLGL
jgi:nitroreductase